MTVVAKWVEGARSKSKTGTRGDCTIHVMLRQGLAEHRQVKLAMGMLRLHGLESA